MTGELRLRARPRFELRSPYDPLELGRRVKAEIATDDTVEGLVLGDRIELLPRSSEQRLWSPQLTCDLAADDGGSILSCRFGPHPDVWTMYLAMHAIGAAATLGAAIYGASQHLAGQTPWALWALPAAPLMAALVWGLAFVGQNLGSEQMYALRRFLEKTVDVPG
jgi:hypothetical protein